MTAKESIELLNDLYLRADFTDRYGDFIDTEPYSEAIELATNALDRKIIQCKYCEHYINIIHEGAVYESGDCSVDSDYYRRTRPYDFCSKALGKDGETDFEFLSRGSGIWIEIDDDLLCSNCGATYRGADRFFCPHCGAYMRW